MSLAVQEGEGCGRWVMMACLRLRQPKESGKVDATIG